MTVTLGIKRNACIWEELPTENLMKNENSDVWECRAILKRRTGYFSQDISIRECVHCYSRATPSSDLSGVAYLRSYWIAVNVFSHFATVAQQLTYKPISRKSRETPRNMYFCISCTFTSRSVRPTGKSAIAHCTCTQLYAAWTVVSGGH
jgi:hypothetical protein